MLEKIANAKLEADTIKFAKALDEEFLPKLK